MDVALSPIVERFMEAANQPGLEFITNGNEVNVVY